MVKIDDPRQEIGYLIYDSYVEKRDDERREHLGASIIGRECDLEVWMKFRWWAQPEFSGRMLRLFETGHLQEGRLANDLRAAGMTVHEFDPDTGKQYTYSKLGGHFGGSGDGIIEGVPGGGKKKHQGEYKTHNDKSFKKLRKEGVKKSKFEHYVQTNLYTYWEGLDRWVYVAVNKNDEDIYIERGELDMKIVMEYEERAAQLIFGAGRPDRMTENPTYYKCKHMCDFYEHCHGVEPPEKNCRTCTHSRANPDGTWRCAQSPVTWMAGGAVIDLERQKAGCDAWEIIL